MNSQHICAACRRTLARVPRSKHTQWTPRATFISIANTKPRTTTDEKTAEHMSNLGEKIDDTKRDTPKSTQRPRRAPKSGERAGGDLLQSLFEESLAPKLASANEISLQTVPSLEPYHHAETLKEMLKDPKCVVESWHFFLQHFGPNSRTHGSPAARSMPSYLHTSAAHLLRQIMNERSRDPFIKTLPSVSEVSWTYSKMGLLNGHNWSDMVLGLLENILKLREQSFQEPAQGRLLLMDLLGAWNVVCRNSDSTTFSPVPTDPASFDWHNVPHMSRARGRSSRRGKGLMYYGHLTPFFSASKLDSVPLIAVATFILLEQDRLLDESTVLDISDFKAVLNDTIKESGSYVTAVLGSARGTSTETVSSFVNSEWAIVREIDSRAADTWKRPAIAQRRGGDSTSNIRVDIPRRLATALAQRSVGEIDGLWLSARQLPISHEIEEEAADSSAHDDKHRVLTSLQAWLCSRFITAYMALEKPNRAIDVWNHMVANGLPPGSPTWAAMLKGARLARDGPGLQALWTKLVQSGVKPDENCWNIRISGLIDFVRVDDGLQALHTMGRLWETAKKRSDGSRDAIKPTIETINLAISALLRKRTKDELAYKVLAWAAKFDIAPNVRTYNILLRPMIRRGRMDQVSALLRQMQASGLRADDATFTVILDKTFREFGEQTPEEQLTLIDRVFEDMERAGIEAGTHLYSKVIYELLQTSKTSQGDMTAVNAVLNRMGGQGLDVSPHIYTILIQHYFSMQPPDLDAVRSVLETVRFKPGSTDRIFWDRVLEGYARAGETAAAMRILAQLDAEGNDAGWLARTTLLIALVQNGEWDVAKTLVENVERDSGGPISPDVRGKEGQHKFWAVAREMKLR